MSIHFKDVRDTETISQPQLTKQEFIRIAFRAIFTQLMKDKTLTSTFTIKII